VDTLSDDAVASRALFVFELPPEVAVPFFTCVEDVLSARWKRVEHERERVLSRPGVGERERSVRALLLSRNLERTSADLAWLREARALYTQFHAPPTARVAAPRRRAMARAS
jgi:hypothetical protein